MNLLTYHISTSCPTSRRTWQILRSCW